MRKVLFIILIFVSILGILLQFGVQPLGKILGVQARSGVRIEANQKSKVIIDDKEVGETPFEDENLVEGEYLITLRSENEATVSAVWQGYVKLNAGTFSVVNRELSPEPQAQSGEVITLEKGKGVTVITTPTKAEVSLDGVVVGRTPITLSNVPPGEHQFVISKDNFLNRSIKATLLEGYNLVLSVDMAIAEADLTKLPTIPDSGSQKVVIKNTPTGFLRIRSNPSINANEVGQLKPADEVELLEELPNWYRIRSADGKEGYVSSSYAQKKS